MDFIYQGGSLGLKEFYDSSHELIKLNFELREALN